MRAQWFVEMDVDDVEVGGAVEAYGAWEEEPRDLLVPLSLHITVDGHLIRESFLWSLAGTHC